MSFSREHFNLVGKFGEYRTPNTKLSEFASWNLHTKAWLSETYAYGKNFDPEYLPSTYLLSQQGHIETRAFVPSQLVRYEYDRGGYSRESIDLSRWLRERKMPPEATWFYVESIFIKSRGKQPSWDNQMGAPDTFSGPLSIEQTNTYLGSTVPGLRGDVAFYNDDNYENYTTIVDGKEIVRRKIWLKPFPNDDRWLNGFNIDQQLPNAGFMGSRNGVSNQISYYFPFQDRFTVYSMRGEKSTDTALNMLPDAKLDNYYFLEHELIKYEMSMFNRPFTPRTGLQSGFVGFLSDSFNIGPSLREYKRGEITGDVGAIVQSSNVGNILRNSARYDVKRYMYMVPDVLYPPSSHEETEYVNNNQNTVTTMRASRIFRELLNFAGFLSPFTFGLTIMHFIRTAPNIYMSYMNEVARKADALLNYSAKDVVNGYLTRYNSVGVPYGGTLEIPTTESVTVSVPMYKAYYDEAGNKCYADESAGFEIPVNKLFKSVSDLDKWIRAEPALDNADKFLKIKPFMDNPGYAKAWEIYAQPMRRSQPPRT